MIPPNDELKGFVLLENPSKDTILLSIGKVILVNKAGLTAIGSPMYINVFFDECGKRMMVRKAEKKNENIFFVKKHGISDYSLLKETILRIIEKEDFPEQTVVSYLGHKVKNCDSIIFNLGKVHMMRKFPRNEKTE